MAYEVLLPYERVKSWGPEIILQEERVILFSGSLDLVPSSGTRIFAPHDESVNVVSAPALATGGWFTTGGTTGGVITGGCGSLLHEINIKTVTKK
jgi:hypothetical protein